MAKKAEEKEIFEIWKRWHNKNKFNNKRHN